MDLREECRGAKKIGISGHIRPDGDCVGVCLSLQMYLRKLLPEAEVTVYLQKPSEEFSYLKGYDEIQTECPDQDPFDVYFALSVLSCWKTCENGAEGDVLCVRPCSVNASVASYTPF